MQQPYRYSDSQEPKVIAIAVPMPSTDSFSEQVLRWLPIALAALVITASLL